MKGFWTQLLNSVFQKKNNYPYCMTHQSHFTAPLPRAVFHGTESIWFLGPKIWDLVSDNLKSYNRVEDLKENNRK